MRVTLKVLLAAAVVLLAYMCYRSIMEPIEFDKERTARESAIEKRLIDIRTAQIEYKNRNGRHAGSFEELAKFLNESKLPFVIKEGVLTDEQLEKGLTEKKAAEIVRRARQTGNNEEVIRNGLQNFRRDTMWVSAKDTLLGRNFNVDSLAYIPVKGVNAKFQMDTATLESSSGYTVKVFECRVPYDVYLGDLNKKELANLKDKMRKMNKYEGLKVGSVTEINNNAGNWE